MAERPWEAPLAEAGRLMKEGSSAGAAEAFGRAAEAARAGGDAEAERDAHMGRAEALWQAGDRQASLLCYDDALKLAEGEDAVEGVINIGKGFALLSIGDFVRAEGSLRRALELCGDNSAQAAFVSDLVKQAEKGVATLKDAHAPAEAHEHAHTHTHTHTHDHAHGDALQRSAELAAKAAFAKGALRRSTIVCVLKGTPWAPQCGFSLQLVKALRGVRAVFSFVDVMGDAALADAFKRLADWPTIPMLFVDGQLLGGSDIVEEYVGEGTLRRCIEDAITADLSEAEREALFSGEGVESMTGGGCGTRREDGSKGYSPEHKKMLARLVTRVAAEACGSSVGPSAEEPISGFLVGHDSAAEDAAFVASLSKALGGFEFPPDLLSSHQTVDSVVAYVVEHCPAEGDCNKCPTKETCQAHDPEGGAVDIEDLEKSLCGIPKADKKGAKTTRKGKAGATEPGPDAVRAEAPANA